jgi:hypothetical protein
MVSCANIVAPTGGPKDVEAPNLTKQNTQDSSLNFKGGKLYFDFDEFIKVQNVQQQFIITPFVKTTPKITAHKKRVTINLHDSILEPNTTYQFFLGNAIQDMHEGNAYKNLSFTFSTGSYFDSLTLKGSCIEAETGMPDTASYIVLYPKSKSDTAFLHSKPMYAQKTKNGSFTFEHLPNKDFYVYALHDLNNNFFYDGNGEQIAFQVEPINPKDTSLFIQLYSFVEKDSRDTSSKKNKMRQGNVPKPDPILNYSVNVDTVSKAKRTFDISNPLFITFTTILKSIEKTDIRLFQDEVYDASATITLDTSLQKIIVKTEWVEDANYTLKLMKGFAKDTNNKQTNAASFSFRTKKQTDYGYISVRCDKVETDVIQLIQSGKVIAQKNASDTLVTFKLLLPDNYQLRLLHDKNNNGKWDTGQYTGEKRQPELTINFPSDITIKANWENNIDIRSRKKEKKKL